VTRVLLLSQSGALGGRVVFCLAGAKIETHVLASRRLSLKYSHYVKKFSVARFPRDQMPTPDFIATVNDYIAAQEIDCVLASDISSQALLHELRPHLIGTACFPTSSGETLNLLHDKWQFHELLETHGLPSPKSVLLRRQEDVFGTEVYGLEFPVMVKPLAQQAGKGILKVKNIHQLADHVFGKHPYNGLPLIVQEHVPGLDAGLSILALGGKVVARLAQQYEPDGSLSFFVDDEINAIAEQVVELSNYSGVAHFDYRRLPDGALGGVLECNPRFWYSMPAAMTHGINFAENGINFAMSGDVPTECQTDFHDGNYYPARSAFRHFGSVRIGRDNIIELLRELRDILPFIYTVAAKVAGRRCDR
jgi:predicted ATP-grasp superfamily ATP-dependent carboligase